MKFKLIILILLLCLITPVLFAGDKEERKESQTYNITVIVKYEGISMGDIAKLEKEVHKVFKNAEDIKIEFNFVCPDCNKPYMYNMPAQPYYFNENNGRFEIK